MQSVVVPAEQKHSVKAIRLKLLNKDSITGCNINEKTSLVELPRDSFELNFEQNDNTKEDSKNINNNTKMNVEEKKNVNDNEEKKESEVPKMNNLAEGELFWNILSSEGTPLATLKDILLRYYLLIT